MRWILNRLCISARRGLRVAFLLVVASAAHSAWAQGASLSSRLTAQDVAEVARVLRMSPEEAEAASSLHEALRTSLERSALEVRRLKRASDAAVSERLSHARESTLAWRESLRAFQEERRTKEATFLEEVRVVAGVDEVDERWEAASRLVRRLELRRLPAIGVTRWANVDLRASCAHAKSTRGTSESVLRDWELAVDTPLRERVRMWEDESRRTGPPDDAHTASLWRRDLAIAQRVAGVTRSAWRRLKAELPAEEAHAVEVVLLRQVYPLLSETRRGADSLALAAELAELSAEQRERLHAHGVRYRRMSTALDDEVIRVSDAAEPDLLAFQLLDESERAPVERRGDHPGLILYQRLNRERAELEHATENHVRSLLTSAQRDTLNMAMR